MSEGKTQEQDGARPFEERIISMLIELRQDMSQRFDALDTRVAVLEAKSYDTKPIWERALSEILETRREVRETKIELRLMREDFARARVEHEILSDRVAVVEKQQRQGEQTS